MIWLPELGTLALVLSMAVAMLLWQYNRFEVIQRLVYAQASAVILSFVVLGICFYQLDFSVWYVTQNANTGLPWYYRLSAIWGAHEGAMLLWLLILNLWILALAWRARWHSDTQVRALKVLSLIHLMLGLFILATSNPFARALPIVPLEGADLNPLLQDIGLIVHPPILYMGYVGMTIPYAIAVALLWGGVPHAGWAKTLKPWACSALAFLTVGITLGSWWAYYELGWGGWWFWDPVENASFMPWLMGLALLHVLLLHQRTQAEGPWVLMLAILCCVLSLLGTFLVRSGVLSSVHAFANDPKRGVFILLMIMVATLSAMFLYIKRAHYFVRAVGQQDAQTKGLRVGMLLVMAATATVLLGTLYPLLHEAVLGQSLSVGPPYFNTVFVPFALLSALLAALLPHLRGRALMRRHFYYTIVAITIALLLYNRLAGQKALTMAIGVGVAIFLALHTLDWWAHRPGWHRRTLGVVCAHMGFAVLIAGISLTTHLDVEKDVRLHAGQSILLGDWGFTLTRLDAVRGGNYEGTQATVQITHQNKPYTTLYPEKRYYHARQVAMTETALSPGFWQDLYVAMAEPINDEEWVFRIYRKPFVRWLWLGGLMMAMGTVLLLRGRENVA